MMKKITKRLAALVTALVLLLGLGATVAAEAPATMANPAALKLLNAGGAIGFEASMNLNVDALKGILGMVMGATDEQSMTSITTVISALNKLKLKGVYTLDAASAVVGTDKGELLNFQTLVNKDSKESAVTTNLLPGISLSLDPAMVAAILAQQNMANAEELKEALIPYSEILLGFVNEQMGPKPEKSAEPIDIPGVGQFHYKAAFDITSHEVLGLVEKLMTTFKADKKLQGLLMQNAQGEPGEMQNAIEQMEKDLAEQKLSKDEVGFVGTAYMNEPGDAYYFVVNTAEGIKSPAHFTLLLSGANAKFDSVKFKLLTKTPAEEETASEEAIDWAKVEEEITTGKNFQNVMVQVDSSMKPQGDLLASTFNLNIMVGGMNIKLEVEGDNKLDKVDANTKMSVYFNGPQPLLSVSAKMFETQEKPVAPVTEGNTVITLKQDSAQGELPEKDEKALMESLQKGVQVVMENLNKALPEEGPTLLAFFMGAAGLEQGPETVETVEELEKAPANP